MTSRPRSGAGWLLLAVLMVAFISGGCGSHDPVAPAGVQGGSPLIGPGYGWQWETLPSVPPLEQVDLSRVVVELAPSHRPAADIAGDYGLVLLEEISDEYVVLQGDYELPDLEDDPEIEAAAPSVLMESQGSDFVFGFYEGEWTQSQGSGQSALASLQLSQLHAKGTGDGVRVMVVDTGVDPEHPFLEPHLELLDPDEYIVGSIEPATEGPIPPAFGHGTHVAGCVLQVAPAATIVPVRILNSFGQASLQDFVRAMAAALDPQLDIDIVNLSMSTATSLNLVNRIVDKLTQQGVVVVAAAGNYDPSGPAPPPSPLSVYAPVVGVIAVDPYDVLAPFSRFGTLVDMAAPGVGIESCFPGVNGQPAGYTTGSGTSFATPLVAGSIACIMDAASISALNAVSQLRGDCVAVTPSGSVQDGRVRPLKTANDLTGGGRIRQ